LIELRVRGAPNHYECREGVLNHLEEYLKSYGFKRGAVIHGKHSLAAASPYIPEITQVELQYLQYGGECSEAEIDRISEQVLNLDADFVLGLGGGKVLDLAKAVGNRIKREVILIPTLAATCAAWTPLSVIYDEQGRFVTYQIYPRSTLLVLVEPRILLASPVAFLRSGIGDTLAKWYEAEWLTRTIEDPSVPIQLSLQAAQLCKEILLHKGVKAIEDMEKGCLSIDFVKVAESILVAGGMVGGYGDQYGRIAVAHSIHNGLTVRQETHHLTHGEKVAYGILIQLALDGDWEEVRCLIPLYRGLKLPYSLRDLGIAMEDHDALTEIAERALAPGESIHLGATVFTKDDLINAFLKLEEFQILTES
jgi:uncharacterized oxidoreductase